MPFGLRMPAVRLPELSPFGPIFGKELRATARRRRNYVLRVLYLAALLLALLVAWSGTSNRVYTNSVSAQAQAQAQMGAMFFAFFAVFSATAMAAIGPVLTSTAISAERLGKTLHVLLMTPITTWQIISGKLFSRLLVAMTLIGLSLPALALVRLLGGVELGQMVGIVCLCVATVLASASIGLLFSTFMNRAYAAILLSYGVMLLLYAFVPFVLYFGFELNGGSHYWVYEWTNWMTCAITLADPRGTTGVWDWWPCVLVHLGLSAVLVTASALVLRRTSRRAGDGRAAPAAGPAATPRRGFQPVGIDVPPDALVEESPVSPPPSVSTRPLVPARDVSDHPVLWRETRRPLMAKPWQAVVGAAATVVLLLVTYLVLAGDHLLDEEFAQAGYSWVFNLVVWLLTAVLAGTAIASEKESDTWTLLLATPLSGHSIVWGKVMGLYKRLIWPGVLIVTHFLAFTLFGVIRWPAFFIAVWVIFSFNSVWVATGLYLSVRVRKVTFAVIINLLLAVVVYLAAFFVLLVISELFIARELPEWVAWYLPYYYLGEGITTDWSNALSTEYMTLPGNLKVSGYVFLLTVVVVGLMHLALAFAILQFTAASFDRMVGRAGGRLRQTGAPIGGGAAAVPGSGA
jgi:ABC-type transport system involved in multi-copper enzyme maturation permease subunit